MLGWSDGDCGNAARCEQVFLCFPQVSLHMPSRPSQPSCAPLLLGIGSELIPCSSALTALQVQHLTAQQGLLQGELQRLLSKNTSLNSTLASAVTTSESQAELLDILNEAVRSTVLVDEHAQQLVAVGGGPGGGGSESGAAAREEEAA